MVFGLPSFFEDGAASFFRYLHNHSFANPRFNFIELRKRNDPAIILHFTNSFGRIDCPFAFCW